MVKVLVCGVDEALSELLALNLARRGFEPCRARWAACCGDAEAAPPPAELIVADLDCPEPDAWLGAARARELFPARPLIYLGHGWPDLQRLRSLQPCGYIRKPFAVDELLRLLRELSPVPHR